ncbi:MAG: hypothetical protein MUC33_01350 [Desulfobacterales bacterium]|jgi:hypothetical protein|nr:hypothetical protein [Desulfobacterales bacterium]MCU0601289.1 hypothetical protein [Desulfobacterales bacterium]
MIQLNVKSSDIKKLVRTVDTADANIRKAQLNAIKVEGFSLKETIANAIRMGKPAPGNAFAELSIIARTINRKTGLRQPRALQRLAAGLTYVVNESSGEMRLGFTSRSPFWVRRAAEMQQKGFSRPVTPELRMYMRRRGAQRSFSRSRRGRRLGNPLFLRLSTKRLVTPPRPIIAPFWAAEKDKSAVRIRRNFRLIARGAGAPGGVLYTPQEFAMW